MQALAKAVASIRESQYLMSSPVAYMADLLQQYAEGRLTPGDLARESHAQTKQAQFVFFHMPQQLLAENRRVFANEFAFADELYQITQTGRDDDKNAFTGRLLECVQKYAMTVRESS